MSLLCFSCPLSSSGSTPADLRNGSTVTEFILVGFEQSSPSTRALLFALFLALYSLAMAMNGLIIFITWIILTILPALAYTWTNTVCTA